MNENAQTGHGDGVDEAIACLLRTAPETWADLDQDGLTAVEQEALGLLTAAGMVERRFSIRLSLIGHPAQITVTATATGDHGLAEAMEPVLRKAWDAWQEFWSARREAPEEQRPKVFCEKAGSEMWRLTRNGVLARQDLDSGNSKCVLDFVYRRPPVFTGMIVSGYGRAERLEATEEAKGPEQVTVTNLNELAGPLKNIAEALQKGLDKLAEASSQMPQPIADPDCGVSSTMKAHDLESTDDDSSDVHTESDYEHYGGPEEDPYDSRVASWFGKRVYLGRDTQVSRLFWLLAKRLGVPHDLGQVQRAVDGMETNPDDQGEQQFLKSMNRVRKAVSKLRDRLREHELDTHVMIVKEGPNERPSYTMIRRF